MTEVGSLSDIGCSRTKNEDSIGFVRFTDKRNILAIVADGMGGHQGGDVASQMAVKVVQQYFSNLPADNNCIQTLKTGFEAANKAIYQSAQNAPELLGMGTTLVVLAIIDGNAYFANTGDSRLYQIREGECLQISQDHTVVAEMLKKKLLTQEAADNHPDKHIITSAIGTNADFKIDTSIEPLPLKIGDSFLLCSDGLTDLVKAIEIWQIVSQNAAQEACNQLVDLAKSRGGYDNISVIVINISENPNVIKTALITLV